MVLTDTHTHIYYETDSAKLAQLLNRCREQQVNRLFLPNVDSKSVELVFSLAKSHPDTCFAMLGMHPCDVKAGWEQELETIMAAYGREPIYAVGEIGIDLYWDKTFLAEQQLAFKTQIAWAKQLNLPIVIHCRDAFDQVYEILQDEYPLTTSMAHLPLRPHPTETAHSTLPNNQTTPMPTHANGIFHCFGGTLNQAQKVIERGFYLGIGGVVTYKNAGLDKIVEQIDLKHLVLETDSPYLTPVPHRGKPNESSYLSYVAQKVADLHRTDLETVARITTANSQNIFGV